MAFRGEAKGERLAEFRPADIAARLQKEVAPLISPDQQAALQQDLDTLVTPRAWSGRLRT